MPGLFEDVTAWLFAWVGQDEARVWIFIAVTVIAILMWAVASLMDLGPEFGISALAGLIIAANSGFFLGFAVFTMVFLALFIVMGSVVGRWALGTDFVVSVAVGWIAAVTMGALFGLLGFTAAFLLIGGVLNRRQRARPEEKAAEAAA